MAEALEAGADPKDTIKYPSLDDSGNPVEAEITLGDLQPFLQDTFVRAEARVLWLGMEQRAMNCHSYSDGAENMNPDLAGIAVDTGKQLLDLIGKARGAGIPADKKMEFWGNSYTDSDVWYVYGNSATSIIEWWRIRGWRFKGDKIAEQAYYHSYMDDEMLECVLAAFSDQHPGDYEDVRTETCRDQAEADERTKQWAENEGDTRVERFAVK